MTYSNVNAVEEMVNMISASRSYQNNVEVMNTAKSLLLKTLQLGQPDEHQAAINGSATTRLGRAVGQRHRKPTKPARDRFLKLLVAQIQNQDPLNPLDNAQVTTQMAQINTVNGIEKLNRTVAALGTQFASLQVMQGASLVGRDVTVPGDRLTVDDDGAGSGGFELAAPADRVKVEILNAARSRGRHPAPRRAGSGRHSFDWTPRRRPTTEQRAALQGQRHQRRHRRHQHAH